MENFNLETVNLFHSGQVETGSCFQKYSGTVRTGVILKDVCVTAYGGELMAVLGSRGSGKRALLDVIARQAKGPTRGRIALNGVPLSLELFNESCAFINFKTDEMFSGLTVKQSLQFCASLVLSKAPNAVKRARVSQILADFALTDLSERQMNNLTLVDLRRLQIAHQMMKDPILMLMDEPTVDLDPLNAYFIVSILSNYVKKYNRMAITTLEKPRSDIFPFLDRITYLCLGEVIYTGPTRMMLDYFRTIGFPCPELENPLMYYLCLSTVDRRSRERFVESSNQISSLVEKFKLEGRSYGQTKTYTNYEHSYAGDRIPLSSYTNPKLPPPPDGGWGWVIVFACFMCNFILDGIAYSFGVMLLPLVDDFESTRTTISWVGSLLSGIFMLSGPLVGGLVNQFGCRPICIAGGVTASFGLGISIFSPNEYVLMICYGVIGGFGLGLVYLPSVVNCGYYFETKRALATGMSVCGSGIGCFAFAPLTNWLLQEYGWKGTNLIFAGLCLNCCVFGAFMRPLEVVIICPKIQRKENLSLQLPDGSKSACRRNIILNEEIDLNPRLEETFNMKLSYMADDPILDEEQREEQDTLRELSKNASQRISKWDAARRRTISDTANQEFDNPTLRSGNVQFIRRNVSTPGLRRLSAIGTQGGSETSRRKSIAIVRPISRKDIFYGGSITSLATLAYGTSATFELNKYRSSVVSVPRGTDRLKLQRDSIIANHLDIRDGISDCNSSLLLDNGSANVMLNVVREMFDLKLLRDKTFVFLCLSNILGFFALYVPFVYLPNMMVIKNIPIDEASFVLSAIGISNTIGRIIVGWSVDFPWASSFYITNISLFMGGLSVASFAFCSSFTEFFITGLVFGFSLSAYIALTSILLVDLLGLDSLTSAFGILVSFRGFAAIFGPPVAGMVFDLTESYDIPFFMA
eukprot:maker-scaffold411_size179879-snap-gene-0.35 protein:Tk06332 transcript:maker-scaffold411_size179879-snap-gene-0.35-mRNA-1 annotation:"monocarboxylate transporter 4-like isoform x1"